MDNTIQTDYLIIGAGAMGMAFADEIFNQDPKAKMVLVDKRSQAGGHWVDAYPFVKLHQPAAFYGVNSLELGNGTSDLSSKPEILDYYKHVLAKMTTSGRVIFLGNHEYKGNNEVVDLNKPHETIKISVDKKIVDATYMNVEIPSTHKPKYSIAENVPIVPINKLEEEHKQWENFYVIGCGKTGMDAILFLLKKGIAEKNIYWIAPNSAWLFNRDSIQVGNVANQILSHAKYLTKAEQSDDIFLAMEKQHGVLRIDESELPKKWRCATVNPQELNLLRSITNTIKHGRIKSITENEIEFSNDKIPYQENSLFVDCSADGLAKRPEIPIFSAGKITLQSILFCQQVFSAATIAKIELLNISEKKKNEIIPLPHPEFKDDWPSAISLGLQNIFRLGFLMPLWMFKSRLNFMSHEPILKFYYYAIKATMILPSVKKATKRLNETI